MTYQEFLNSKIKTASKNGIEIDSERMHPSSFPHQKSIVPWALSLGAALIAADCGMGKTHMGIEAFRLLHEEIGGKYLIVTELGASETWVHPDPEVGEGARLNQDLRYFTHSEDALKSDCNICVTNYERVRNGDFHFKGFTGVWLDEGNYIKNIGSETTETLGKQLKNIPYKYIATATPSPNEHMELINYAHILGIADRGQILTQFFQRNSTKAGELTIHPQHEEKFWMWVNSWSVFITDPTDLGFERGNFILKGIEVNWHLVPWNKRSDAYLDKLKSKDGQMLLVSDGSNSLPDSARIKRETIQERLAFAIDLIAENPEDHFIIWHHLEDERIAIEKAFKDHPSFASIFGKQNWEIREKNIVDFSKGDLQILATKPEISGVGCNFQKHCHRAIFLGLTHSFDELYQAIKRIHRFGNNEDCTIDILYVSEESDMVNNVKRKWNEHDETRANMRKIVLEYGLGTDKIIGYAQRSMVSNRKEYKGENYTLVNNDCVNEWKQLPDNSIDLIVSSFPFGNHYEYTDKYNDFGHNSTNKDFANQLGFLVPELLRTLKPGRICAVHLKNRIHYGSVTGIGFSQFHRFTHLVCDVMEQYGFYTMGFHYIPTDVVMENNQTYRLTYGEMKKDSTKMGSGIPEEIWIFRKAPTSNEKAYADERVTHEDDYSLSQWQLDADSFWKSSGNMLLNPEIIAKADLKKIRKMWDSFDKETIYDFNEHIKLLESLDENNKLSRTFTTLPFNSNTPFIWSNINRMHGLNLEQARRKQQNHICPMPFDEVERLIELYSNKGELVADPFGGLGTTGYCALKMGRKTFLTELNERYAQSAAFYLNQIQNKKEVPTLFDLVA